MNSINSISNDSFLIPNSEKKPNLKNGTFQDILKALVTDVEKQIKEADKKSEDFAIGKNHDLHEIMIAAEKADLSFRFLLQIRNKLLEAYQEIMRMHF